MCATGVHRMPLGVRPPPGDFRQYDRSSNGGVVFEAPWHRSDPPDVSRWAAPPPPPAQSRPRGRHKGRCSASCHGGRPPDHKSRQHLSFLFFFFTSTILIKVNPSSWFLSTRFQGGDSTSGLTQNANFTPLQQLVANLRTAKKPKGAILPQIRPEGAFFFCFIPADASSPDSHTLPFSTFQLQRTRKTLTSRLHLAAIDRFHAVRS